MRMLVLALLLTGCATAPAVSDQPGDHVWLYCGAFGMNPCPSRPKPWWVKTIEALGGASDSYYTTRSTLPPGK